MPRATRCERRKREAFSDERDGAPRLYLDFEGNKAGRLFLGCYRLAGETVQVVLDAELAAAAEAKGLQTMSPEVFFAQILQLAKAENAVIAAWSNHEKNLLERFGGLETSGYENLLKRAKSWVNRHGLRQAYLPQARPRKGNPFVRDYWGLSRFTAWALNEKPPHGYAKGKTTSRLTDVINGLKRAGSFEGLTPTQKRKWGDLLMHNRWDTEVLERLPTQLDRRAQPA